MTTAKLEAHGSSCMTTDGILDGCILSDLSDLTHELTSALNGAIVAFMLRAELEEAFDSALLREAFAGTPTFGFGSAAWA